MIATGDRLSVALAQPLRVEAGDAELDRPLGRTFAGQIVRRRERASLAEIGARKFRSKFSGTYDDSRIGTHR